MLQECKDLVINLIYFKIGFKGYELLKKTLYKDM